MSKAIRFPALAAALAGALSFGAQAAVVPQTVSSFALQTTTTDGVVSDGTNKYTLKKDLLTGAWYGDISKLGNGIDISGAQIVSSNGLVGLMFQSGVNAITLTLSQSLQINALTINVLNAGLLTAIIDGQNSLSRSGDTSATQATPWELEGDCAGAATCASPYLLTETDTGAVTSIELRRTDSKSLLYLMTGLTFVDYSATTSNNVPEPASYGLAALALVAAGAATRRRAC